MNYRDALMLLLYVHNDTYNIDELEIEQAKETINEMEQKAIAWDKLVAFDKRARNEVIPTTEWETGVEVLINNPDNFVEDDYFED